MLTLGIDTSNYATSLAVFDTDAGEVVCDCKKFLPVKEGQLGLRQSDALFHHTAALPAMLAELGARADLTQVRAVGVSARPRPVEGSYMPCFLAGVSAATAFSLSRALPLIALTHQQGHIAAALYAGVTCISCLRRHHRPSFVPWGRAHHAAGHKQRSVRRTGCGPPRRQAGLSVPGGRLCQRAGCFV